MTARGLPLASSADGRAGGFVSPRRVPSHRHAHRRRRDRGPARAIRRIVSTGRRIRRRRSHRIERGRGSCAAAADRQPRTLCAATDSGTGVPQCARDRPAVAGIRLRADRQSRHPEAGSNRRRHALAPGRSVLGSPIRSPRREHLACAATRDARERLHAVHPRESSLARVAARVDCRRFAWTALERAGAQCSGDNLRTAAHPGRPSTMDERCTAPGRICPGSRAAHSSSGSASLLSARHAQALSVATTGMVEQHALNRTPFHQGR